MPITESDKRRYIRYEVLDYAHIIPMGSDQTVTGVIVDIGLGGIQVRTKSPMKPLEEVTIRVGRSGLEDIYLHGEVRHSMPIAGSDLFATGIRFKPSTHEERIAIAEFVHGIFQRQCDLLSH